MIDVIPRDLDGVPLALSVIAGLGPPTISPALANYNVFLNGRKVSGVVAFDCQHGTVWIDTGRVVGDEWEISRRRGTVKVEPVDEGF